MHLDPTRLPPDYHDQAPRRGPWIDPTAAMPVRYGSVSVLLADGTTEPATWTGRVWWRDRELRPVGWRPYEPSHRDPGPPNSR